MSFTPWNYKNNGIVLISCNFFFLVKKLNGMGGWKNNLHPPESLIVSIKLSTFPPSSSSTVFRSWEKWEHTSHQPSDEHTWHAAGLESLLTPPWARKILPTAPLRGRSCSPHVKLRTRSSERWDLNLGPLTLSLRPSPPLKCPDFRRALDWPWPQGFHYRWTGGRWLCMFLLSFGNPALIILFPQREAWWLPVAYGLTKIGEDIKMAPLLSLLPDGNQADCFLFGGSGCEKPKAAGKPQMGENKNHSPHPLVRICFEEPGMKATGLCGPES